MNQHLEKLLTINRKLIDNASISELVKNAIDKYKVLDELIPEEEKNCQDIYKICESKFPESVGKKPAKKKEEKVIDNVNAPSEEDTFTFLRNQKQQRIVR